MLGCGNVGPVIRSVLAMVGKTADHLPSVALLSQMLVELKQVSLIHIAEALHGQENTTLYSDGTSKFGRKFGAYQNQDKLPGLQCGNGEHEVWNSSACA